MFFRGWNFSSLYNNYIPNFLSFTKPRKETRKSLRRGIPHIFHLWYHSPSLSPQAEGKSHSCVQPRICAFLLLNNLINILFDIKWSPLPFCMKWKVFIVSIRQIKRTISISIKKVCLIQNASLTLTHPSTKEIRK